MLPTRILRLLEFVGFSGNKVSTCLLDCCWTGQSGVEELQHLAASQISPLSVGPWTKPGPCGAWSLPQLQGPMITACLSVRCEYCADMHLLWSFWYLLSHGPLFIIHILSFQKQPVIFI